MMEKIFKDEEQPLFGRDDSTIKLNPFNTETIKEILSDYKPDYTSEDLLALWTITGGVARYVTQSEIEGALGMKSLGGQMKILEDKYGIIKKKRPIGAKEGSQTVSYEIQDNFFRFWFRYIHRYSALIELQNMPALERIMTDDYSTFSGIALERWFRQKMMESCRYKQIGGWWQPNGVNSKGNKDDFEIDIVAETLDGNVEAYEVKRNPQKYSPARLEEKVTEMKQRIFRGKEVIKGGLSMEDM